MTLRGEAESVENQTSSRVMSISLWIFRVMTACLAFASLPSRVTGQSRRIALSGDLLVGAGARTDQAAETYYLGSRSSFASLGIALALPGLGRFRPLITGDRSSTWGAGDQVAICGITPNGTCRQYFPGLAGYSAGAGVRTRLAEVADLDLVGGLGSMSGRTEYAAASLAIGLTHVRLVGGIRHIVVHHESGQKLWWRPVSLGLRLQ